VVREGVSDVHVYYVPKTYIRDYDGSQLWIEAPSTLVRPKFEKESEPTLEELRALARDAPRFKRTTPAREQSPAQRTGGTDTVVVEEEVDLDETGKTTRTTTRTTTEEST
jgi:hypothetical protein